jgi:hypothetical protein
MQKYQKRVLLIKPAHKAYDVDLVVIIDGSRGGHHDAHINKLQYNVPAACS